MIKRINPHNFLTTPFIAVKSWELFNIENDEVILLEPHEAGSPIPDTAVAQDYVDYYGPNPILNRECNIALEQQEQDILIYQEGLLGSGKFFPDSEPTNPDGTYKRLVYNTINRAFYNNYNDPTKIFGLEYIDFPLGQTVRNMANNFRVFNIPQLIYGDKILPGTIQFFDTSLDDNMVIKDDGYQNLIAGYNLFSKIQEVRNFGNTLLTGSYTASCLPYGALSITQPQDYYADVDDTVLFNTTASGTAPFIYQWQSGSTYLTDNAKFTGSITNTLLINNVQESDMSSSYRVMVSNLITEVTSSYANLYINVPPLSGDIVAYWKLDTSYPLVDSTGNGHTLTPHDTMYYENVPGVIYKFLRTTVWSSVDCSSTGFVNGYLTSFAVSGWFQIFESGDTSVIGKWADAIDSKRSWVIRRISDKTRFIIRDLSNVEYYIDSNVIWSGWTHIAFGYDYSAGIMWLQVNNESRITLVCDGVRETVSSIILVGGGGAAYQMTGKATGFDEIGVWNRSLSTLEVNQLWNGGAGLAYPFI